MKLTFSDKLKEIRAEYGLNIRELARVLGINYTLISMLESGKRQPSSEVIEKVASYTGLDRDYLEFLAFPIPVEYKRIISESERAPDFVKAQVDRRKSVVDSTDQLIEYLFCDVEMRPAPSNRQFYSQLIADLNQDVYPPKVQAWAEYYDILVGRDLQDPRRSIEMLQSLYHRTSTEAELRDTAHLRLQIGFRLGSWRHEIGEYDEAICCYKAARDISQKVEDDEGMVHAHLLMGMVYQSKGENKKAIQIWQEGIDQGQHVPHLRGRIFCEIGGLHCSTGQWDEAIDALTESANIFRLRTINDPWRLAEAHVRLTEAYIYKGEFSQAAHWNLQSFSTIERIGQRNPHHSGGAFLTGQALCNKAHISFMRQRPNRARQIVEQVIHEYRTHPLLTTTEIFTILKVAFRLLGHIELQEGNHEEARAAYLESLKLSSTKRMDNSLNKLEIGIALCHLHNQLEEHTELNIQRQKLEKILADTPLSSPKFYHQLSKLSRLKGTIAFDNGNVEEGINLYIEACEYIWMWNPDQISEMVAATVEQLQSLNRVQDLSAIEKLAHAIRSWAQERNLAKYFDDLDFEN